ncbi:MAG: aminopeptidase P family protein, partial [Armatimonadetes bacterium]|nr:aminopeptidase P family protein [Armatimonadota bacterium]
TTVAALEDLQKELPGVDLVPLRKVVEPLRLRKSPEEVELIRRAAHIADQAYQAFLQAGPPQVSEKLGALELLRLMLEAGADDKSFDTILACGPGAAEPHHQPDDRIIEGPAPLKIDMGAKIAGYCSDMTRTLYLGGPDETFVKVYRAVYEAQQAALELVRAGVRAREVDAAARRVIEEAGYGEQFSHGLGHGVGLEVHEGPSLGSTSEDVLEEDHVVTIEPGVYLQGWGGVRIEDLVLVTADGAEVLSQAPKPTPDEL